MRAIRLVEPGRDLELCDVEVPVAGAGEVLVEAKAVNQILDRLEEFRGTGRTVITP